ncbi:MAG: methionine synthase [Bacteroidota bacterium]|nr:methionine synthase [Bacteroidota bacterium]
MKTFSDILKQKVIVFDGAMGTNLQTQNLNPDDFGGEKYFGCNEYLVVSKPLAVEIVHTDFLTAGCDVIETNTFGGASIVLDEYELASKTYELNYKAAILAKNVASGFYSAEHPRFVAGSIGPTTKLPSLGHISFKELEKTFYIQAKGLIEGGVDLLVVETCQDVLQTKAALAGIYTCLKDLMKNIPVIVSVTIETTSTMLLGTEISAALAAIEPFPIDAFGVNCATGPQEMSEHIRYLQTSSPFPIFCMPNAGIPENIGGKAHYHLTPDEFTKTLSHYVKDFGVNIVGGCCGTTNEHIRKLAQGVGTVSVKRRKFEFAPSVSSLYQSVPLKIDLPPILVGERMNSNGSKAFRELLLKEDWEGMIAFGKEEVRQGSHILDLSVAYTGRNEITDIQEIVRRYNTQITVPLMIDSTNLDAIETALQQYAGKAIINSVNLEDGEGHFARVMELCKRYGAAVIALTIDESGMAKTVEQKIEIAERMYHLATNKYGIKETDLIFDLLTFTLGSGDEEFRNSAIATLEAIHRLKKRFPNVNTSLGLSNISFGLSPKSRVVLNSVFLHYAVQNGLDMAIVHASKILPLFKISEAEQEICRKLIFNEHTSDYDPLIEFINFYSEKKTETPETIHQEIKSVEDRLKYNIIDGDKTNLQSNLEEALKDYKPLEIVNQILLNGMKVVGEYFGAGKMQLPFVLQSAEVMKTAVAYLEPLMEKSSAQAKGTMVLATVKGDVHDIGKNLVDIILSNNGYRIINLGIRVPIESMLQAAIENKADAIGMSGLLVKSTAIMKDNLEVLNERNVQLPVVLGGAALTRRFVEEDLRNIYGGTVEYANDAFDGLKFMEHVVKSKSQQITKPQTNLINKSLTSVRKEQTPINTGMRKEIYQTEIPNPPFWGSKVVEDISLDEVFKYINETALIKGQWQVYKGDKSEEDYKKFVKEEIYPEFESLKVKCKQENLLQPKVVYGYFPCNSDGNDLIIYNPSEIRNPKSEIPNLKEWLRFTFPRQKSDRLLSLSDFFVSKESGKIDVVAIQLVTVGKVASAYSQKLFSSDKYKEYLYFHGLSVETAEALAEMWHKKIREELGIHLKDSKEMKKLFSQGYQGSRYSFGYPACPNLEDQTKLFEILQPERIGVELTEEFHLIPEQSTSAIIVHHPEAKYFSI